MGVSDGGGGGTKKAYTVRCSSFKYRRSSWSSKIRATLWLATSANTNCWLCWLSSSCRTLSSNWRILDTWSCSCSTRRWRCVRGAFASAAAMNTTSTTFSSALGKGTERYMNGSYVIDTCLHVQQITYKFFFLNMILFIHFYSNLAKLLLFIYYWYILYWHFILY